MPIQKYSNIDSRFSAILISTVEGYIKTCAPVSSKFVQGTLPMPLSTATIRSVMSSLEQDGFCVKPINQVDEYQRTSAIDFILIQLILLTTNENTISELESELKTISNNVDEL